MFCFRLSVLPSCSALARSSVVVARAKHTPAIGRKRRAASTQHAKRKALAEEQEQNQTQGINWYPGHIAKAEKELSDFVKKVDVVVEVRDARIPASTTHPSIPKWVGPHKTIIVVVLRIDQTSPRSLSDWKNYYRQHPPYPSNNSNSTTQDRKKVYFIDGKRGKGDIMGLRKQILSSGLAVNKKRQQKGIAPRPVRAAVIGFPNVGKSSLINRILGRKLAKSQNVAGHTRKLQWIRMSAKQDGSYAGGSQPKSHVSIEMLDSPGIIPATQLHRRGAMRLAICNDIGTAAYDHTQAAAALCDQLNAVSLERKGYVSIPKIKKRYGIRNFAEMNGEDIVHELAAGKYDDQLNAAADVLLADFRKGQLGQVGLEVPPEVYTPGQEDHDQDENVKEGGAPAGERDGDTDSSRNSKRADDSSSSDESSGGYGAITRAPGQEDEVTEQGGAAGARQGAGPYDGW
mmetsp:Transcript_17116/g.28597  ORF Transcript_17116/g.28597 Transcript_17116/m.28597 type:complete len:458 (-) Transcript_17116:89-1462(-)